MNELLLDGKTILTLALIGETIECEGDDFDSDRPLSTKFDPEIIANLEEAEFVVPGSYRRNTLKLTEKGATSAKLLSSTLLARVEELEDMANSLEGDVKLTTHERAFWFRVELVDCDCWRELIVPSHISFKAFHEIIQAAFLWWNYHLYDFRLRLKKEIVEITDLSEEDMDSIFGDFGLEEIPKIDASMVSLDEVFPKTRNAVYSYDYGDGWEHKIRLLKTIACYEEEMPVCVAGDGDAPPEDVGGPGGFEDFLRIIADEHDDAHDEMMAWGESQVFERFSLDQVNERIREWLNGTVIERWDKANSFEE